MRMEDVDSPMCFARAIYFSVGSVSALQDLQLSEKTWTPDETKQIKVNILILFMMYESVLVYVY
jgi:hypothetical protein